MPGQKDFHTRYSNISLDRDGKKLRPKQCREMDYGFHGEMAGSSDAASGLIRLFRTSQIAARNSNSYLTTKILRDGLITRKADALPPTASMPEVAGQGSSTAADGVSKSKSTGLVTYLYERRYTGY
jgi:hypothetical protein